MIFFFCLCLNSIVLLLLFDECSHFVLDSIIKKCREGEREGLDCSMKNEMNEFGR